MHDFWYIFYSNYEPEIANFKMINILWQECNVIQFPKKCIITWPTDVLLISNGEGGSLCWDVLACFED